MERKRNLVRHSFKDGSRGRKQSGPTSAPPAQQGGGGAGVEEDDAPPIGDGTDAPILGIIRPVAPVRHKDLPILASPEDIDMIRRSDPKDVSEEFEVILIESDPTDQRDDTLLPTNVDRDIVGTLFPNSGMSSSNELADALISTGGFVAAPGMPKPNATVGIGMAKTGDIIKSINSGDYMGAIYDASPILALNMNEQSGSIDRFVNTAGLVGSLIARDPDTRATPAPESEERKPSEHISEIMNAFGDYDFKGDEGLSTGGSLLNTFADTLTGTPSNFGGKVGSGFESAGRGFVNMFSAASKFDSMSDKVRSLPGIRKVEEDRYYTVFFYPRKGITYIEWKPTEDVRNLFSRRKFSTTMREWGEDFIAAAGMKVPAWTRRVNYIKGKYGSESDNVVHFGYSRGGGLATHLGGTGYGTGYFPSYEPARKSKSKLSGDFLHDAIINPMSYMLLLRKKLRPF